MFKELHVSRFGFYNYLNYQKNPTIKEVKDQEDFKLIKQTYDYRNRHKGVRQIKITLSNTFGIKMNLKKIRRLMKKYGLYCPIRKANPYRRMIKAMKTNNYAFNKLNRNFKSFKQVEHLLILFIVLDIGYTLKYLWEWLWIIRWRTSKNFYRRAFLKDVPIILFDEATASLDVENETLIQSALSRLIKDKTVLVIAHRMMTVAGADKIVVLSNCIVAEQGKPDELYAENGIYTHMVDLQSDSGKWKIK